MPPTTPSTPASGLIDDADPRINYTGSWSPYACPDGYNNTLHGTSAVGASAIIHFTGNSISVYGPLSQSADTVFSFSIDNGQGPTIHTNLLNFVGNSSLELFVSPSLADGPHTLVITNQGSALKLDYFNVSINGVSDSTKRMDPPSHPSPSARAPSHAHSAAGSAGLAVGVCVFVVAIISAIVVWFQRRRRVRRIQSTITPFTVPTPPQLRPSDLRNVSRPAAAQKPRHDRKRKERIKNAGAKKEKSKKGRSKKDKERRRDRRRRRFSDVGSSVLTLPAYGYTFHEPQLLTASEVNFTPEAMEPVPPPPVPPLPAQVATACV